MATKSFPKYPTLRKRIALELFRLIKRNESKTHKLHTLFWECTLRCNVACRHCGSDCRVSSQQKDMPREDFLRVIDEILPHVDPHRLLVIFTGGEALLRNDLALCGQELNRREFPWGVVSNGYLMTASRLQELVAAGMHTATISLDGFEQAHNWLRRNPRSFERALNAIRLLGRYPEVTWDVVTCVNMRDYSSTTSNLPICSNSSGKAEKRDGSTRVMAARAFWVTTNTRYATNSSYATPVFMSHRCWPMALSQVAPASGPTFIKVTSIRTHSGMFGKTVSNLTVTGNGRMKANARIARCSDTARGTACT